MKLTLIFPPQWVADHPYLSVPSLAAFVRESGRHEVTVRDVNVESYDYLLNPQYVAACYESACEDMVRLRRKSSLTQEETEKLKMLSGFLQHGDLIVGKLPDAVGIFEDPESFYRFDSYKAALDTMRAALGYVSMAHYPTGVGLTAFSMGGSSQDSRNILNFAGDAAKNPYLAMFRMQTVPSLLAEDPDMIGLSIVGSSQLAIGLSLAAEIKRARPDLPIVVGGPLLTLLADQIAALPQLFDLFDYLVLYEGEKPLLALLDHLAGERAVTEVPNLMYREAGKVVQTELREPCPIDDLPTPDFAGMPLSRYQAPDVMLPLLASRGCYWRKCSFCQHSFGYHNSYRVRDSKRIVEDLRVLGEKHGVDRFIFNDEAMSPALARALSREIRSAGLGVKWAVDVRAEKAFTSDLCREMAQSGCHMVYVGLESGSDRVLGRMRKGIRAESSLKVLRNFAAADIWAHAFLVLGFPGETRKDAEKTARIVLDNPDAIHSVAFLDSFVLARHCDVHRRPERYSVNILAKSEEDLVVYYDYDEDNGRSEAEKRQFATSFWERIKATRADVHLWYHILRGHFLHYCYQHGTKDLIAVPGNGKPADRRLSIQQANLEIKHAFRRPCPKARRLAALRFSDDTRDSETADSRPLWAVG